jgi:hypothetical protein
MAIGQVPEFLQGHIVRCWHFVARASVLPDKASMGVVFQADQGMDKPLMTGNSEVTRIWQGVDLSTSVASLLFCGINAYRSA